MAAAANQATANNQNAAASRGCSLHRVVLLLAAVVDATLWYCVYKALVSDEGGLLIPSLPCIRGMKYYVMTKAF